MTEEQLIAAIEAARNTNGDTVTDDVLEHLTTGSYAVRCSTAVDLAATGLSGTVHRELVREWNDGAPVLALGLTH